MTKAQELAILDETIARLGPDSYLGPWLGEIRFEIEGLMRSDVYPAISLKEAAARAATVTAKATEDAAAIAASAERARAKVAAQFREFLAAAETRIIASKDELAAVAYRVERLRELAA